MAKWVQNLADSLICFGNAKIPVGATEAEIEAFETEMDMKLPPELLTWLKTVNGLPIGTQGLFGIGGSNKYFNIGYYLTLFPKWKEKGWIPIGTDGSGNYYVVATNNEYGKGYPVLFVDTAEDPSRVAYIVASSVRRFFDFFVPSALDLLDWHWPFDKERVLSQDPALENCFGVDLPWQER